MGFVRTTTIRFAASFLLCLIVWTRLAIGIHREFFMKQPRHGYRKETVFNENSHKFMELRAENVDNQWENVETVLVASRHHHVPLLLFDIDILPNIFVARDRSWKDTLHRCKVLCKHHPEEKNVITFAALYEKFAKSKDEYLNALTELGFTIHLSHVLDPSHNGSQNSPDKIPSYLWMARRDHIIHISFLHERGDEIKYLWIAPVSDGEWRKTVNKLAPMLSDGWHSLEAVGAKFPRHAQAFDKSHRFTGYPVHLDGHRISVPYHIKAFLDEYSNSHFIECSEAGPDKHLIDMPEKQHGAKEKSDDKKDRSPAQVMLTEIKKALDLAEVPFWITGGTLLGWYRQCNFISHDSELDIAIWSHDYHESLVRQMEDTGYTYVRDSKTNDSFAGGRFVDAKGRNINILFFDLEDDGIATNIRVRREDGKKFVLTYPSFHLCWTEFLGIKVGIPCDSLAYLESYFGRNWFIPNQKWVWHLDAMNKKPFD